MNPEARARILAAADELSIARDLERADWAGGPLDGNHEETVWWRLNDLVLALYVLVVRER